MHPELQNLRVRLQGIHDAISNFRHPSIRPLILDSSQEINSEDDQWTHQENVPGLRKLRETIKTDLDLLEQFLNDPKSAHLPPLSTNSPYLIAVWNEVVCAPLPVISVFKTFVIEDSSRPPGQRRTGAQRLPTVKVDVVADNGRRWIRVNTIKYSRMLAELREIDSYLTDSSDDSDNEWEGSRPTLAQTEFDNSILRMGRALLEAAKANPIEGTDETPQVTLRLTRLEPSPMVAGSEPIDHRIGLTIEHLSKMGIQVELGERSANSIPTIFKDTNLPIDNLPPALRPTTRINLDLSVLIALISDLTHAPLPKTTEQACKRFDPPQQYKEWKQHRLAAYGKSKKPSSRSAVPSQTGNTGNGDIPHDFVKHTRALTNQLLQEMKKGILQEIKDKSSTLCDGQNIEFWTTPEARNRCIRIVLKIGGENERRRAFGLFQISSQSSPSERLSIGEAEDMYWQNSRYPRQFVPLIPIHIFPSSSVLSTSCLHPDSSLKPLVNPPEFFASLFQTCTDILALESNLPTSPSPDLDAIITAIQGEIERAAVTKANSRLTAHTVQSLLWGARLGWTTLTANRTSVKAMLKEVKAAKLAGRFGFGADSFEKGHNESEEMAAIWIVDPRSLAEGMSSSFGVQM